MGWDSPVGIATHYGLDGPGIKFIVSRHLGKRELGLPRFDREGKGEEAAQQNEQGAKATRGMRWRGKQYKRPMSKHTA